MPIFHSALRGMRVTLSQDHPAVSRCLINLASTYKIIGQEAAAEPLLLESTMMMVRVQ